MPRSPVTHPIKYTQGFLANPGKYPYTHGHSGVDIHSPNGDDFVSCVAGVVHIVNPNYLQYTVTSLGQPSYRGYGAAVCLDWGQGDGSFIRFLYGHGKNRRKSLDGKQVNEGIYLGESGNTGISIGYHLHFEMRHYLVHGEYYDRTLRARYDLMNPKTEFFDKYHIT